MIIDRNLPGASSKVAAGVINPVTGKRLVKSWMINELNKSCLGFYKHFENVSNKSFFYNINVIRVFNNYQEQNDFISKSSETAYKNYLVDSSNQGALQFIKNDFGSGIIQQSAFLDTKTFLDVAKNILQEKATIVDAEFKFNDLNIKDTIEWNEVSSKRIIFCEGYRMKDNPFFGYLPLPSLKGEFLLIEAKELPRNNMIKKGVIIVPYDSDLFWVGSTYDRDELSLQNTEKGVEGLTEKLNQVLKVPYTIKETGFGIRPTVVDRRPLIGCHPHHKNLFVFNGLGSKGVSLAPYFAQHFIEYLEQDGKLMKEVDIVRYQKKFTFQ